MAETNGGYRVKATVLRAYTNYLEQSGLLAEARASLSAQAVELLEHPPLPWSWVDGGLLSEMLGLVAKRQGVAGVHRMSEHTLRENAAHLHARAQGRPTFERHLARDAVGALQSTDQELDRRLRISI